MKNAIKFKIQACNSSFFLNALLECGVDNNLDPEARRSKLAHARASAVKEIFNTIHEQSQKISAAPPSEERPADPLSALYGHHL